MIPSLEQIFKMVEKHSERMSEDGDFELSGVLRGALAALQLAIDMAEAPGEDVL